jgi:DNA-binding CsgD family transcriptional regulator/PAS domain-containing protein
VYAARLTEHPFSPGFESMAQSADLDSMIRLAYGAAEDATRWPDFLNQLKDSVGAVAAGLFVQDVRRHRGRLLLQVGGDPHYIRRYHEYYSSINPWFQGDGPQSRAGAVTVGLDSRRFLETEYYEDFWRPQGFGPTLSGYFRNDGHLVEGVLLIKEHRDRFRKREINRLDNLTPWLQQATRIWQTFSATAALRSALMSGLDHLNYGVVLLDCHREIVVANEAAQELLAERDGVSVVRGEIVATGCRDQRLADLIDACVRAAQGCGTSTGGMVVIERSQSDQPLAVRAVPLPAQWHLTSAAGPAVLLLLVDEGRRPLPDAETLQVIYSLSPAEALVAAQLAQGLSLDEIAEQSQRDKETLRTQLRTTFEKTGTSRQTALACLVLNSLASVRRPARRAGDRSHE